MDLCTDHRFYVYSYIAGLFVDHDPFYRALASLHFLLASCQKGSQLNLQFRLDHLQDINRYAALRNLHKIMYLAGYFHQIENIIHHYIGVLEPHEKRLFDQFLQRHFIGVDLLDHATRTDLDRFEGTEFYGMNGTSYFSLKDLTLSIYCCEQVTVLSYSFRFS